MGAGFTCNDHHLSAMPIIKTVLAGSRQNMGGNVCNILSN